MSARPFVPRSVQFRREREAAWTELEALVDRVERAGLTDLDADEIERLAELHRGAMSALSVARAISLDKDLLAYLSALAARSYLVVYEKRWRLRPLLAHFFAARLPALVASMRGALLVSILVLAAGAAVGAVMVLDDPEAFHGFVSPAYAHGRGPDSTLEELRDALYTDGSGDRSALVVFASSLFSRNAGIGLLCFALGIAAGVPVFLLLFVNGLILGAFTGLYARHDLTLEFWAWVLPHGVTELLAVCVCGAAGLTIGRAVVLPGRYRRLDELAIAGRRAAAVVVGAVAMFLAAALIEGLFRQLVHSVPARLAVAAATAAFWAWYFGLPRPAHMSADLPTGLPVDLRRVVALQTPEEVTVHFELAPVGSRFFALTLDLLIILAATLALVLLATLLAAGGLEDAAGALAVVVFFLLRNFYFAASELRWQGRTPGKRRLGLRVIARDGGPLTAGHVLARNLTRELELFLPIQLLLTDGGWLQTDSALLKPLVLLWLVVLVFLPIFNRHRARMGDLVAGTLVVVSPRAVLAPELATTDAPESPAADPDLRFTKAQLDVYGIHELQVLEDVLRRPPDIWDDDLIKAIAERVKTKIDWPRHRWEVDPLRFLTSFYAAQRQRLESELLFGRRRERKVR